MLCHQWEQKLSRLVSIGFTKVQKAGMIFTCFHFGVAKHVVLARNCCMLAEEAVAAVVISDIIF